MLDSEKIDWILSWCNFWEEFKAAPLTARTIPM